MDVFKIDQSLNGNLGSAPSPDKITPEVSFDAGSEFNLCFFDTPEDSNTQGFSDPGSVGSASASSPPPQLAPLHIPLASTSTPAVTSPVLLSPPQGATTTAITVKQGKLLKMNSEEYSPFKLVNSLTDIFKENYLGFKDDAP
ncbi:unnamed protein product [Brassicogethes aeneus]|uniref:Uncharacterized protein n=1 Tax=Brassicogethes aeneus TaxID=1431903 RepID=A0A9P0FCF4_BRAAE|nr:unnamed protein product [Brassicogethes aeneus]